MNESGMGFNPETNQSNDHLDEEYKKILEDVLQFDYLRPEDIVFLKEKLNYLTNPEVGMLRNLTKSPDPQQQFMRFKNILTLRLEIEQTEWPELELPSDKIELKPFAYLESFKSGILIPENLRRAVDYFDMPENSKDFKPLNEVDNPIRQEYSLAILATYIHNLNQKGISPRILEIGAGPSRGGTIYEGQPPRCSRGLLELSKNGILDINRLVTIDPNQSVSDEAKYGILALPCEAKIKPEFNLNLNTETAKLPSKKFTIQAIKRNLSEAQQAPFYVYGYSGIDRSSGATVDPESARSLLDNGPYDIIFEQCTQLINSEYVILASNGGVFWENPYLLEGEYTKTIEFKDAEEAA